MRYLARVGLAVAVAIVAAWTVASLTTHEDDVPVDPTRPDARRAAAIAQRIVPGRVVEVARDTDNGKWEVIIAQEGHEFEVELAPGDFGLLRLDYD